MQFPLTSSFWFYSLFSLWLALLQVADMQNNIRGGVRRLQKSVLAWSSSARLARMTQNTCMSVNDDQQRSLVQSAASRRAIPYSLNTYAALPDERDDHVLRMLMFGKPGAGKGTLTRRLAQKYDIVTLSTGDLLRQHIAEGTEVGKEAEEVVARGGLVPDELMLKVLTTKLDALQDKHWILDGFPRTLLQGEMLDAHLKKRNTPLTLVVNLDVPDEVILGRISDRWVHLPSGRVYNMSYNRPRVAGFDDQTGEALTKRPDDNPEIFARRLAAFYASTSPLLTYFSNSAKSSTARRPNTNQHPHQLSFHTHSALKVKTLSGSTSDEIWPQLDRLLQNSFPNLRERLGTTAKHTKHLVGALEAELRASSSA
ncbi:adenylate kinase [Pholiota conissans]|uniref:Adenylate kinase n=1 Tax=Pholiota conissans TaxID=109636 RepID=A0A9P6D5K7_9AGAR|nr:adenylate kinase [Pholiota conissans]